MISRDKKSLLPAVTLACIAPVLTELLSGNIPAWKFFLPWVYCALLLVYGLPVLLIRELFIAWKLRLPGLFLLGLAYGIFNEGICAKTLLLSEHVPIDAFDHYTWLGINFPWAALIVPWHAFHAIMFPIALVTWWFPASAHTSWLPRGICRAGVVLLSAGGVLIHLTNQKFGSSLLSLLFFTAVVVLIFLSKRTSRSDPFLTVDAPGSAGPIVAGISFYPALVLGISICAGLKLPSIAVCAAAVLLIAFFLRLLTRKGWLRLTPFILFALGDYLSGALLTGLVQLKTSPAAAIANAILALMFVIFIFAALKSRAGSKGNVVSPAQ